MSGEKLKEPDGCFDIWENLFLNHKQKSVLLSMTSGTGLEQSVLGQPGLESSAPEEHCKQP